MSLKKPNATTAAFEDEATTDAVMDVPEAVEAPAAAAPATTALATARPTALATAKSVAMTSVLSSMKDTFHVEYDSLPSIGATQGSFSVKADDTDLGSVIQVQLLSFQDSFVCSPNDTKAEKELVKYSDDGVTAKDGTDMKAHLEDLKQQGFKSAKIAHRVVLVGELLQAQKDTDLVGSLVQIDLPDSGRRSFNTYNIQASYAVAKGKKSAEEAALLTLKAVKEKTSAGDIYTKVVIA